MVAFCQVCHVVAYSVQSSNRLWVLARQNTIQNKYKIQGDVYLYNVV